MSFADVLAEIPKLSPEERREVMRLVAQLEDGGSFKAKLRLERKNGELVLVADRVIRQAEVDAILADWP